MAPSDMEVLRIPPGRGTRGSCQHRRPPCAWHLPQTQAETRSTEGLAGPTIWSNTNRRNRNKRGSAALGSPPWSWHALAWWPWESDPNMLSLDFRIWKMGGTGLTCRVAARIGRDEDLGAWHRPGSRQGSEIFTSWRVLLESPRAPNGAPEHPQKATPLCRSCWQTVMKRHSTEANARIFFHLLQGSWLSSVENA